ncbi:MAG: helix-turn-helix transcriptional regulator [Sulfurimonas sp.]|nr:helix-turn-helix transcriptional regulator [Sulfurimonas sp.]
MIENELDIYSQEVLDTVSANVKKYRELKGFSQIQLALEIGMSSGAYLGRAEIRKNNHHFNIVHVAKISKVLDVPITKFFESIQAEIIPCNPPKPTGINAEELQSFYESGVHPLLIILKETAFSKIKPFL